MKLLMTAVLIFCLAFGGCTSNQVLVTLEASVAATEVLVASLAASGKIDPNTAAQIENAIVGLPVAFQGTSTELATTDPPGVKYAKIALLYAPTLTALNALPPTARAYASAVVAAIQSFLHAIQPPPGYKLERSSPAFRVGQYKHLDDRIFELTDKIGLMQK